MDVSEYLWECLKYLEVNTNSTAVPEREKGEYRVIKESYESYSSVEKCSIQLTLTFNPSYLLPILNLVVVRPDISNGSGEWNRNLVVVNSGQ